MFNKREIYHFSVFSEAYFALLERTSKSGKNFRVRGVIGEQELPVTKARVWRAMKIVLEITSRA